MRRIDVPDSEIEWSFGPSGGPGGQHANRSATRAELRWNITGSRVIDDATKARLMEAMPGARTGTVIITADSSRSQWRNRQEARARLEERIATAMRPTKRRRPTKMPAGARARRRQAKRKRSEVKRLRRRPDLD